MNRLRGQLADYLEMRRALGFALVRDGKPLAQFLDFLEDQGTDTVTIDAALAWASMPGGGRSWMGWRMSIVRSFAAHLHTIDPAHQVLPAGLLPAGSHRMVPYLYSDADIAALVEAADTLRYPLGRATYRTLIGLLATTGMRVGEALASDDPDLDPEVGVLTVRKAKSQTSRIVPLHASTLAAPAAYQGSRRTLTPRPPITTPGLFVSTAGTRLAYVNMSATFPKLLTRAGISARSGACRPRIHDPRHSFAVATLIGWYRDGGDVAARLPLLSTHLGHSDPKSTYWYLHAAPELLALAADRLNGHRDGRP